MTPSWVPRFYVITVVTSLVLAAVSTACLIVLVLR